MFLTSSQLSNRSRISKGVIIKFSPHRCELDKMEVELHKITIKQHDT